MVGFDHHVIPIQMEDATHSGGHGSAMSLPNQQVSRCRRFWVADLGAAQTAIAVGIFG